MPKYSVLVTRDTTQHTYIEVEADDGDKAEDIALDLARNDVSDYTWTDDDYGSDPYIADPGGCAEELDEDETTTREAPCATQ